MKSVWEMSDSALRVPDTIWRGNETAGSVLHGCRCNWGGADGEERSPGVLAQANPTVDNPVTHLVQQTP